MHVFIQKMLVGLKIVNEIRSVIKKGRKRVLIKAVG
jgi:hypothetical protein